MLTAQWTPEEAREKARLGGINSGISKRAKKQAMLEQLSPDTAQTRAKLLVHKVLTWMERSRSKEEFGELAVDLDRVWNKAFPTQGAARPSKSRSSMPELPPPTPQENLREIKDLSQNQPNPQSSGGSTPQA